MNDDRRRDYRAIAEFQNPLMRGLTCAALHPGLRSILAFDASPATLQEMVGVLARTIAVVTGGEIVSPSALGQGSKTQIVPVQLGTVETEEELWGSLTLDRQITSESVVWKAGLLAAGRDRQTRIVVIPDITRLSLAARRACVMLVGAKVAHLERHGRHDCWQPQLYWLAGCDRHRVGMVSPHLLDRFALRLSSGKSRNGEGRVDGLRNWLEREGTKDGMEVDASPLSPEMVRYLQQLAPSHPEMLPEARERVLDYLDVTEGYSPRRDLALLRLARVQARLEGAERVTRKSVDLAAETIGLSLKSKLSEKPPSEPVRPEPESDGIPSESGIGEFDRSESLGSDTTSPDISREPVFESDTTTTLSSTPFPMGGTAADPYPEDTAEIERESASLRLPPRRVRSASSGRGAIIGVEPTAVPQDLALVSTLLEAAKYQKCRWRALLEKPDREGSEAMRQLLLKRGDRSVFNDRLPLILQSGDLRRYRRAALPEQMLTVVLDYTCLQARQWHDALLPYLQWAYVERASVCLVQVGAVDAGDELRAEKHEADNILVPRIQNGLELARGRATPLAHGLDLALQTLRHRLQHGRSAIEQAVLVVVSDGRGNVPLEASRSRKVVPPVGRRGIEDALLVARQIAALKGVESVVLNPQPKHYSDLPVTLAQALGAKIAAIPSLNPWEVDEP